jgi:hypothetical protein
MISGQRIRLIVAALGDDGIEMLHCGSKDPNLITGAHGYFKSDVWTDPVDRDKTTHNVGCIGRSLHTLVAKFKTKTDGLVVKIDCEGGEWSMMRNRQSDEAVRSADYLTMEAHTFGGSLNGATYEEIANWTNRFAETHDALIPEIEQCCQGGFMLGLLKKGFVSEERTDRLKRHFLQQVAGRATILTD